HYDRSFVTRAEYTVKIPVTTSYGAGGTQAINASGGAPIVPVDGKYPLAKGTVVRLVFASAVSSKTAQVGDAIPLTLAEDLKAGNLVVAKKGTPAAGRVIQVDKTGAGGAPGVVSFEVDTLDVNGTMVKLSGTAEKDGDAKLPNAAVLIPVVGPFTAFKHG